MQSGGAHDRERFLHQHFGAAVAGEPRLADSLFEVEVRPNVGRHVRQAVFATLPPPSEPDVIPPIRSAVHQLDHRVTDAFSGPAAAEHFGQRALRSRRIAEAQEHDSHVTQRAEAGIMLLRDRKSTRLNSSHANISYAVFCLKKKNVGKRSQKKKHFALKHPAASYRLRMQPLCLATPVIRTERTWSSSVQLVKQRRTVPAAE